MSAVTVCHHSWNPHVRAIKLYQFNARPVLLYLLWYIYWYIPTVELNDISFRSFERFEYQLVNNHTQAFWPLQKHRTGHSSSNGGTL